MIDHTLYSSRGISSVSIIRCDCVFQFHIALAAVHITQVDETDQLTTFMVNDRLETAILCPASDCFLGVLNGFEVCSAISAERFITAYLI